MSTNQATPRYAAFILGRNPRLGQDTALRIADAVVNYSLRYRVDARLVMAMLIVESDFDPNAVSRAGAQGLGQLMPGTARWMGVRNSFDVTDNLYGMVKLLRTHMNQFRTADGSDPLVLAAYNAGDGAVRRHGGVPPYRETQAYIRRVVAIYQKLCGA
ncbi:lytic transglycosylase domain-containing protein [bacterium]|nr:MAG: lytic transglycosylase domain-containing protein [bacterium]